LTGDEDEEDLLTSEAMVGAGSRAGERDDRDEEDVDWVEVVGAMDAERGAAGGSERTAVGAAAATISGEVIVVSVFSIIRFILGSRRLTGFLHHRLV